MDYCADSMFKAAAALAAKGWKIVKLFGVQPNLKCTCGKHECPTPGKHPIGREWQHRATDDENDIERWFDEIENHTRINLGVRLGATSGIIDVEFDSPDAEAALRKWGLDKIDTPAYSSGRGVHRIFQHEDWMPDSAVVKVEGIEVRIGGGGMASQSVIPPSWHKSSKQYSWLPGKSPNDVNPAKLPDAFREAVMASSRRQGSGVTAQARKALREAKKVSEGGRHGFLIGIASKHSSRIRRFDDDEREEITQTLLAVNAALCEPPKSEAEVIKIAHDQFAHYRDRAESRRKVGRFKFEDYGLAWNPEDRCWEPGEWRLTVVASEPAEFKLRIPHPDGRRVVIRMSGDDWVTPKRVAVKVLEATGKMDLCDPNPGRWVKIWNGESVQNGEGAWESIRGLKCMLADIADVEIPSRETNVSTYNASILLSYLDGFPKAEPGDGDDDRRPNHSGTPKWITNPAGEWCLWLKWNETVSAAWQKAKLPALPMAARRALKEAIIEESGDKNIPQTAIGFGGKHGKWFVFRERHIDALRKIADSI
jgi:hypothetical protein